MADTATIKPQLDQGTSERDLARLGHPHPDPDELIAMRIHGVALDYISAMRSRGVQNLSIDPLVGMDSRVLD